MQGVRMEDENAPAAKKDVWLMRRELEIRLESREELVKQNHLELQEQIRNLLTEMIKLAFRE